MDIMDMISSETVVPACAPSSIDDLQRHDPRLNTYALSSILTF